MSFWRIFKITYKYLSSSTKKWKTYPNLEISLLEYHYVVWIGSIVNKYWELTHNIVLHPLNEYFFKLYVKLWSVEVEKLENVKKLPNYDKKLLTYFLCENIRVCIFYTMSNRLLSWEKFENYIFCIGSRLKAFCRNSSDTVF